MCVFYSTILYPAPVGVLQHNIESDDLFQEDLPFGYRGIKKKFI